MTRQQQNAFRDLIHSASAALLAHKAGVVLGSEYGNYLAESIAVAKSAVAAADSEHSVSSPS